jgi:hypothetical protein
MVKSHKQQAASRKAGNDDQLFLGGTEELQELISGCPVRKCRVFLYDCKMSIYRAVAN